MNGLKYHTVNDLSVRWKKFKLINTIAHNGYRAYEVIFCGLKKTKK